MTTEHFHRYSLIDLEVTDHQSYGILFRTTAGALGFVDMADISDVPIAPEEWPVIGYRGVGVVLGVTRSGKLRASLRQADIELAGSVDDTASALSGWARIRDRGFVDASERNSFFATSEAVAILRWALCQRKPSLDRMRALDILSEAPEQVRVELGDAPLF